MKGIYAVEIVIIEENNIRNKQKMNQTIYLKLIVSQKLIIMNQYNKKTKQ